MNALVRLSDETSTIAADGLLKSEVKRIGDEGMSDRDFGEEGDSFGEETQVVQAQVMPCIELQPQGACVLSSSDEGSDSMGTISRIARSIRLSIELDTVRPEGCGSIKVRKLCPDKD